MSDDVADVEELQRELADLRQRLEVSEAIVRAIDQSEVDAFIVKPNGAEEAEVLVLGTADRPYRLLIERMQQGAATLSGDGTILYSNRRLAEMLGSGRPGLSGSCLIDLVSARDRAATAEAVARGCQTTADVEVMLALEDGAELPVQLTVSPLLDDSRLACVVVTDLSHQRAQEQQRERLVAEEIARAAAEQTAGVLREADRRKDVFLATLAHELRNPLAPLRSGLHVLQTMRPEDTEFRHTHEMLARQVETLVRLVDDLLDVARLTQSKIRLQRARFDLRQVVGRALETCQAAVAERGHRVETAAPQTAVVIEADEVRVTQVITNLLNNAVKFTPSGGRIRLVIEAEAGGMAVLRVSDSGVGIPADLLGRIFEPFAQVETAARRGTGGLGIGLTLARSLVEMHGGTIAATSEGDGRGSEFVVCLPLAASQQAPAEATRPAAASAGTARVLVVDDNRDAAESLGLLLRRLGHEVRLESNPLAVQASVVDFTPDVVLLDVGLPGIDGYEVARRLRADARCRKVRIIGLSGFAADKDRQQAFSAGFDDHFAKPIGIEELNRMLRRVAGTPRDARPPGASSAGAAD